jgi:FixJ family two-component response regulator/DNA-binding MarR family transcriptional regulator
MSSFGNTELAGSLGDRRPVSAGYGMQVKVLVLDDDLDCLLEYGDNVQNLGYECLTSANPIEALRLIENDPTIGIVITDLSMPFMDGITFLQEADARFALLRPVVPIVITGMGSIESAVQAMNSNAVDFITKPVKHEVLAAALRRAFLRRSQLVSSQLLAAFANAQENGGSEPDRTAEIADEVASDQQLIKLVRTTIRFRQRRKEYLNAELFSDPSWDILLELTLAKLQGESVPVSSACAAADVPFTTAYRYVGSLVEQGMVRRWKDPLDQRRVLLELEDATLKAMSDFLLSSGMVDRS